MSKDFMTINKIIKFDDLRAMPYNLRMEAIRNGYMLETNPIKSLEEINSKTNLKLNSDNTNIEYLQGTQCANWIWNISVNGLTVTFDQACNNSWTANLKNSSGIIESTKSGSGYGTQTMTGTTTGAHTLEVSCAGTSCGGVSPCVGVCSVTLTQPCSNPTVSLLI